MQIRKALLALAGLGGMLGLLAMAPAASAASSPAGTAAGRFISVTNEQNAAPRYYDTPIGRISAAENTYLHTHPILIRHYPASSVPASSDPTFYNFGYWCANSDGAGCANNWNRGSAGNAQKYYNCPDCGKDGQYNQWFFGNVDSSFPWGNNAYGLDSDYSGNGVYQYCWAPNGNGSGNCLDQSQGAGGNVVIEPSTDGLSQYWVWDGYNRWVATLVTLSSFINGQDTAWYAGYGSGGTGNGQPMKIEVASNATEWHYVEP